ncbi:hypothetical protein D3C73_1145120 [compost metagenome]
MLLDAENGLRQFCLAVALDTGDGEDLTLGDVEADPVHHVGAVGCTDRQVFHHKGGLLRLSGGLVQAQAHRPAHHHGGEFSG